MKLNRQKSKILDRLSFLTKGKTKRGIMSITQILILIIGLMAFSYAVGSSVGVVSAVDIDDDCEPTDTQTCDSGGQNLLGCFIVSGERKWDILSDCTNGCLYGECVTYNEGVTYLNPDTGKEEKAPDQADKDGDGKVSGGEIVGYIGSAYGIYGMGKGIAGDLGKLVSKGSTKIGSAGVATKTGGITVGSQGLIVGEGGATLTSGSAVIPGGVPYSTTTAAGVTTEAVGTGASVAVPEGGTMAVGETSIIEGGSTIAGKTTLGTAAHIVSGAAAGAFIVWAFYKWVLKADVRNMRDVTTAAFVGAGVAIVATYAIGIIGAASTSGSLLGIAITVGGSTGPVGWVALVIALIIVGLITLFTYKNYSQEIFTYVVTAWKAPVGGDFCEKCNDLRYGCGEYQCKSFGKACEIENKGTKQEICVWKNSGDIFAPNITALDKVLPSPTGNYSYQPLEVVQGVKIHYSKDPSGKGCIPPYTAITLGVETGEFAECKIDTERTPSFNDMAAPMAKVEGFAKEHTLSLPHVATPSVENQLAAGILEADITNGQAQEFYIRCEDVNGNSNPEEFIMEFCVQDGPDTSAPIILGTNFLNYLQFNQTDAYLEIYTNEPAECKWSPEDLNYDQMQFNMSTCSLNEGDYIFSNFGYGCQGTLTGLKDRVENTVYIKCKDKPWWSETYQGQRYANQESFILTLQGTEPLIINEITVNGKLSGALIKDSTNTIKAKLEVKASAGAEQGKSKCEYESGGNFVGFYNAGDPGFVNINTQNLYLPEGDYNISIRCFDAGGNSDEDNIEFTLDTDREEPIVVRAYYDVNNLRIITDEPAECVYNTNTNIGCNYVFDDGEEMTGIGQAAHYTSWTSNKKYYIKCKDFFGNLALPGQCSVIVQAFEISQ